MESINRPELVQEYNLNLVRRQLFRVRRATRPQLSALTGISNVTLGTLLARLVESGEVLEAEKVQSASGRPARMYYYNARRSCGLLVSVGFAWGQSRLHAMVADLYGETVWEESLPGDSMDRDATLQYFRRLLDLGWPIGVIGLGIPGVGFGDYLYPSQHMQPLSLEALTELGETTGISIEMENDVNLMSVGYASRMGMGPDETLAYLYLMKGRYGGSAVYLNGGVHRGRDRFAGELLPPPYGPDWKQVSQLSEEQWEEALLTTALPYLTILAPHRLVIASDYLREKHLKSLEEKLPALLRTGYRPSFAMTEDPEQDYLTGLKQLTLDLLKDTTLQRKGENL